MLEFDRAIHQKVESSKPVQTLSEADTIVRPFMLAQSLSEQSRTGSMDSGSISSREEVCISAAFEVHSLVHTKDSIIDSV